MKSYDYEDMGDRRVFQSVYPEVVYWLNTAPEVFVDQWARWLPN